MRLPPNDRKTAGHLVNPLFGRDRMSLSDIQKITGLGKTTIMRILNHRPRP
jgi:hypothetical protein